MIKRLAPFALSALLAACGPVYQTDYQIVPPSAPMGRMCANNCLMAQQNCAQSCQMQESQCHQIAQLRAQNEYQAYVLERQKLGREIKKSVGEFDDSYSCTTESCEEQCQGSYHICHSNCGGQVIPTTRCVMGCER